MFRTLTIDTLTTEHRQQIEEFRYEHVRDAVKNNFNNALRHKYRINEVDSERIQAYFDDRLILQDTNRKLVSSSHPVLRILNDFCNDEAREHCLRAKQRGLTTMAIGDNIKGTIGAQHNCLKLDGSREFKRIIDNCILAQGPVSAFRTAGHNPRLVNNVCHLGSEHCDFQADIAYSVHSLYDITPSQIAQVFENHKISHLIAYMFIPVALYDQDLHRVDDMSHNLVFTENDDIYFTMDDFSVPYKHSRKNWTRWARVTSIRTKHFRIIVEHVNTWGSLHQIIMTRTPVFSDTIYRSVPLKCIYGKYYKVPSMLEAAKAKFTRKQKELKHHLVPEHVVTALQSYTERQNDASYNYTELATVAGGLLRALRIGAVTYYTKWDANPYEFHDVVLSMFIMGAARRTERSKIISSAFTHLKSYSFNDGLFGNFNYNLRQAFKKFDVTDLPSDYIHNIDGETNQLWYYQPIPILDIITSDEIHCSVIAHASASGFELVPAHDDIVEDDHMYIEKPRSRSSSLSSVSAASDHLTANIIDSSSSIKSTDLRKQTTVSDAHLTALASIVDQTHTSTLPGAGKTQTPASAQPAAGKKFTVHPPDVLKDDHANIRLSKDDYVVTNDFHETATNLPTRFLEGHCAIQAIWNACPQHQKQPIAVFIANIHGIMTKFSTLNVGLSIYDVENYIRLGKYTAASCESAIYACATLLNYKIVVHDFHTKNDIEIAPKKYDTTIHIYLKDAHYTHLPGGGGKDKYPSLLKAFFDGHRGACDSIFDTSAAPGFIVNLLPQYARTASITAGYFVGKESLTFTQPRSGMDVRKYRENIGEILQEGDAFDIIIIDAGRAIDSELIHYDIFSRALPRTTTGGSMLVKTFGNPTFIWCHAHMFRQVETYRGTGTEVYYFLYNKLQTPARDCFWEMYKRFNQDETTHKIPFDRTSLERYTKNFYSTMFVDDLKHFRDNLKVLKTPDNVTFNAITGFASASKTCTAVKRYPKALFIAPTRCLRDEHRSKHGVTSYTPHVAVSHAKRFDTIVIDEFSQFHTEYLMLLYVTNPHARYVIVGDIYQTPAINYISDDKFHHFRQYGIMNNMRTVHRVPQDITKLFVDKFCYKMQTTSKVVESIFHVSMSEFAKFVNSKIPVISFNDSTAQNLRAQGYNAHTITAYTGSRSHTVIFYIDDQSVLSNLNTQRREWVYVAMTRATNQLVFYGDRNYIETYLNIRGSKLQTFEYLNGNFMASDALLKHAPESLDPRINSSIHIVQHQDVIVSPPVSQVTASSIISQVVQPAQQAFASHAFLQPDTVPPVESGKAKVDPLTITHTHRSFKGYRLEKDVAYVRNQVSSDSKETTRTLFKRYGKKLPKIERKAQNITFNKILGGISKALFGNRNSIRKLQKALGTVTDDDLRFHAKEYYTSLQKKIGDNPGQLKELETEFNEFNETLSFVNKRQTKFDAEVGFDLKEKVGQGVAATSKRVNLLMCAYARCMLTKMREIARTHGNRVIFATFDNEAEINDEYLATLKQKNNLKWNLNDFSEWDTYFRALMTKVTHKLCSWMGINGFLNDWFLQNRELWKMSYFNHLGRTILQGTEKQFSGNPFTICENTILNMGLIHAIFDFKNIGLQLYKGDDSAIQCTSCTLTTEGHEILSHTGHKTKWHLYDVGEFAGWVLTSEGMFPDVVRYTAKFLSKVYRDQKHFDEAKASLQERCTAVRNHTQLNAGCVAITNFYDITAQQANILFDFLKNSRTIQFDELTPVILPVLSDV